MPDTPDNLTAEQQALAAAVAWAKQQEQQDGN
jgi:hypothetical protein